LICVDNVCVAALQCDDDPTEPNDNETDAYFLGQIGDGDGEGSTIISELSGPDDTDWFSFDGLDNFGGIVNPYAQLNVQALALCMYAECHEGLGATSVTCPDGTTQQPSPAGRPGCCASNTTGFELAPSCGSTGFDDDSAYIYISVSGSEPGVCQEFTLSYHF
jgi:hypothetical protein